MLRKPQLYFRKSMIITSFALIILVGSFYVGAAKAPRRSGHKAKPNHDAIALSYGSNRNVQKHQNKQVYPQTASAPSLPNNNNHVKPIGWNIPASNTPVQQKSALNTNTGFQTSSHNPGYPTHNYAPPPSNTHTQYPQQPFNSGPPPAHSAPIGVSNTGYPQQGGYIPQQQVGYHPQQGGYHPQSANTNPSYQQPTGYNGAPVINNYYPQQTGTSGTGSSSIAKNALLLGGGALAGAAIYGALKPGEETKTVIIHDTVSSQPPNVSPAGIQTSESSVPLTPISSNVPLAQATNNPIVQPAANAPLAPIHETTGITVTSNPRSETIMSNQPMIPLAPMPDSNMDLPELSEQRSNSNKTTINAETSISTSVPVETNPSLQAHLKGRATHLKAFDIFVLPAISMFFAKLLI